MNEKRKLLTLAIRSAIASSFVAGLTVASPAIAQDQGPDQGAQDETEAAELGRVQVTGSRITRTDVEAANPVTILTREDLNRTTAANLGELIQRLSTENSGNPLTTQTNNGGNGAVTVDLRGFGRTLVLINGRRIVDGGDFQTIPTVMVERVDILKTGASAVYGADAVAGVVNIVTRRNYQGAEFSATYQTPEDIRDEAENSVISGIFGISNDKGYANVGFERRKQDGVTQGQFPQKFLNQTRAVIDPAAFTGDPLGAGTVGIGSSRIPQGVFDLRDGSTFSNFGGEFVEPNLDLFSQDNVLYNFAPANFLQTPFETKNFFAHAGYDLHENVEIYFEGRFSNRTSEQLLAPVPFDTLFDPGFPVEIEPGVTVPGISAENAFNPFGQDVVRVRRRIVEGERRFNQNIDQFQTVIGLTGDIPRTDTWTYDFSLNYGERTRTDIDRGQLLGSRLEQAMGPSFFDSQGNAVCGTPDNPIAGCVPIDFFGGPGSITPEMLDFVSKAAVDKFHFEQRVVNGSITGDLIDLPAGPVGVAIGGELREEQNLQTPDSSKATDAISGNVFNEIGGEQDITSFFIEANAPLLANLPFVESLEVRGAFRFDDFETDLDSRVGKVPETKFDNSSFEAGLRWQVTSDLLVRGTWSEVFTAPGVGTLFAPLADSFPQVADPCSANNWANLSPAMQSACQTSGVPAGGVVNPDPQPRVRVGGNPELGPEEGDTYTAGFVFSPGFIPGLSMTFDWWRIELDDAIDTVPVEDILDACLASGGTGPACSLVERNSPTNPGEISRVFNNTQNIAELTGEGLDLSFEYTFTAGEWGQFDVGGAWTHLLERERDILGNVTVLEGNFSTDDEGFPENKFNGTVTWNWGDFQVDYLAQYVGEMDAPFAFVPGEQKIDAQLYHDLQFTYNTPFNASVAVGATNITDNGPPFIDQAFNGNIDEANHRVFGRIWTFNVTKRF